MIEPYPLNSRQRRMEDIRETEAVADLFTQLELCIDPTTSDHFEKLVIHTIYLIYLIRLK